MNLDSITNCNYQVFYQFVRSQQTDRHLINLKSHLSNLLSINREERFERTLVLREKLYLVYQQTILINNPEVELNIPNNFLEPFERPSNTLS